MQNKFRNELEIKLGEHVILLRPTFENIAATEEHVGSVAYLTWKYSRGIRFDKDGKPDPKSFGNEASIKAIPSLSECAKIIYFNQAATNPDDETLKKYSLNEIWEMVMEEGAQVSKHVLTFLGSIASGGKVKVEEETAGGEKKS